MSELSNDIVDRVRKNLHYIAHEAGTLRPAELVIKSPEFEAAVGSLDYLRGDADSMGILSLRIGSVVMSALCEETFRGSTGCQERHAVHPNEEYRIRAKHLSPIEFFSTVPVKQPYYGDELFFDLVTIGQTLEDGGELSLTQPDSSSSK